MSTVQGERPRPEGEKARGAYFTPPAIAEYLAAWAVGDDPNTVLLDPSCGEAVFLLAAGRRLRGLGRTAEQMGDQVFGVDVHAESLRSSLRLLQAEELDAHLITSDFFDVLTPQQLGSPLPEVDAVIGNPPFVRYQEHRGEQRRRSLAAALRQGVQLSGLASSWAALLVHACAFLKPEGRLAMVLPAELLTVHYAEPVRKWLRQRFAGVHLVMFERLQFADALEKVVLLVAQGSGGCDAFSLYLVEDAENLPRLRPFDHYNVTPASEGKWTDVLLSVGQRQLYGGLTRQHFVPLRTYGTVGLGTVTGANGFFTLAESTREEYGLDLSQLLRISPPGTRHLRGFSFTKQDWEALRANGEAVWLFCPDPHDGSESAASYVHHGEALGVNEAYKCRIRDPWWRPPAVAAPDLFFTYMSHRYPRLIENRAGTTFLNSMHGVRLTEQAPAIAARAMPVLCLNTVTLLGAEIHGRSYGGGVLKMEPREAAELPVPSAQTLSAAWTRLQGRVDRLEDRLRDGHWEDVVREVDQALLVSSSGVTEAELTGVEHALTLLRTRRLSG